MKLKRFIHKGWKKILLGLVVVLGVLFFFLNKSKTQEIKKDVIRKGDLKEELTLSGNINATNYAKLGFESSGRLVYVGVKEGQKVYKGSFLLKLDTTILNSSYQQTLSTLRATEATVDNVHDQVKNHSTDESFAQKDLRTAAEVAHDRAYESVVQAKRLLDGASIYAPFNGIVTYLAHSYSGIYVPISEPQVEIIDPQTIYFDVLADQTEVTKLSLGQKVEIILDSFEDRTYNGKVDYISFVPKPGEAGSVYAVRVKFENVDLPNSGFKIAMSGDAKFTTSEKKDVYYVPLNYLKQDKTGKYLKVNNKNNKTYVETGIESEDYIEVKGNVSDGQTIYD